MKNLLLLIAIALLSCAEKKSNDVVRLERELDSIQKVNKWLIPCLECQEKLMRGGTDSAKARMECEKIYKPR